MKEGFRAPKPIEIKDLNLKTEDIKPIMVCIGTPAEFNFQPIDFIEDDANRGTIPKNNVDYNRSAEDYLFSPLDDSNKFSEGYFNCTGLVIVGIDKKNGKNVSILSHQSPRSFLYRKKEQFIKYLDERLAEVKTRCFVDTIDAVIVGGNYLVDFNHGKIPYKQDYLDSIDLLSAEVENVLEFKPKVINGPKTNGEADNFYLDTANRRLYFMRKKINHEIGDFTASDKDKVVEKLEEKP